MSAETRSRFTFSECKETRTWKDISYTMRNNANFKSGSLGQKRSEDFRVWACFADHDCLSKVSHSEDDSMCYVYHEREKKWYPWGLHSEVVSSCTAVQC